MGAVNVDEEDYSKLYEELPGYLIEEILAWLPAEYLCRFATVCKQWNALFSSTSFARRQWAEAPPNINPWILVRARVVTNQDWWAYSYFTRSWKKYRLSVGAPPNSSLISSSFPYVVSGAGLFLIQFTSPHSIYVCNPLTAKYFTLPPMIENSLILREMGIVEEGEDGYKVLVVRHSNLHQQNIVEIYNSMDKAWTMARLLPRNLVAFEEMQLMSPGTVFSGGYFYCLMVANGDEDGNDNVLATGIMGFNMVDGTSIFVKFPELHHEGVNRFDRLVNLLVNCGSRILLVEGMPIQTHKEEEMIIWEFNKDADTNWKEISRMPRTVDPFFNMRDPSERSFGCVAVGDCLYFKKYRKMEAVVYNFTHNSWTILPNCPIGAVPSIAFTPRLDMKVE